jgi:hypothetical protein
MFSLFYYTSAQFGFIHCQQVVTEDWQFMKASFVVVVVVVVVVFF